MVAEIVGTDSEGYLEERSDKEELPDHGTIIEQLKNSVQLKRICVAKAVDDYHLFSPWEPFNQTFGCRKGAVSLRVP